MGGAAKLAKVDKVSVNTKNPSERTKLATILGDYVLSGSNHNQNVFKKTTPIPGRPGTFAYLYYWDARDGHPMSGWWFGDQIGGNEVWAHCLLPNVPQPNSPPPSSNWKTPWDGPVNPNLVVTPSGTQAVPSPAAGKGTPMGGKGTPAPGQANPQEAVDEKKLEEAVKKANVLVKGVESAVTAVETVAKPLSAENADASKLDDLVKKTEEQAAKAQETIQNAQKEVANMRNESLKYAPNAKKESHHRVQRAPAEDPHFSDETQPLQDNRR